MRRVLRSRNSSISAVSLAVVLLLAACGPAQPSANPSPGGQGSESSHPAGEASPSASRSASPIGSSGGSPAGALSSVTVEVLPVTLPSPLSRAVAFAAGTDILVCGGLLASGATTPAIVLVDPGGGTARAAGSLTVAVHDAGGATAGGRNLVFGGGNTTPLATIQTCDPSGSEHVVGAMPAPRADLSAVAATLPDGTSEAVIAGGAGAALEPDVLATQGGSRVASVGALAEGIRYAGVVALGDSVIVLGGFRDGADISDIQRVDLATGQARIVGHLTGALAHAAVFVIDGQIVLAGGIRAGVRQRAIWSIDPTTWAVHQVGDLPQPLSDAAAAEVAGEAYLVGGEAPTGATASILRLVAA